MILKKLLQLPPTVLLVWIIKGTCLGFGFGFGAIMIWRLYHAI